MNFGNGAPGPAGCQCTDFSGGAANGGRAQFPWSSFGRLRPGPAPRRWKPIWPRALMPHSRTPCSTRARIAVAGRDVTFAADAFSEDGRRSAVASVEAVPGVRLVNDQTRLVPEAKPFVWSAERDVVRVTLGGSSPLPASKSRLLEAARAASRRGRGRRSDEFVARRAAAFRQCRAAAARSDRETEGRQDHAFRTPRSAFPAWRATSAAAKRSRRR